MKVEHPITIDAAREELPAGGALENRDPIARGRVQVLTGAATPRDQALAAVTEFRRLASLASDWDWARAAIIARTWSALDPVRSYCEAEGIPVSDRRETKERPRIWELREYRNLSRWLEERETPMVSVEAIADWLKQQGKGPVADSLKGLVSRISDDLGIDEIAAKDALAWIGDWGREYGVAPNGLSLVTAHSAKGLEFDHVVVLDDAWQPRPNENPDEQRRLFYVAMTRARQSLCVMDGAGPHHFLPRENSTAILRRPGAIPKADLEATSRLYRAATLKDVYIGFGGLLNEGSQRHRALMSARTGDRVQLGAFENRDRRGWQILDQGGEVIGKMASDFEPPDGYLCDRATIGWMVNRRYDASKSKGYAKPVRDEWPIALPELVYRPVSDRAA